MLTRIAEIGIRLVEAEGAKAIAQAEQPEAGPSEASEAPAARDHGLAFARHARTVQRALALRSRAAADLCAGDKADRRARRARQRNHVTEALQALIWDPAQSTGALDDAEDRTTDLDERLDELYQDEEDRIEDRPVASVIAGLGCGLRLSDQWRLRAADWSDPPYPPPLTGTVAETRDRRWARVVELMRQPLLLETPDQIPALIAGIEARLREPDVTALLDAEPPVRAAERLRRSLGLEPYPFHEGPDKPDTG
ncbi:hypothetical protein FFK22_011940 [Mycobacterium sp. KBS0706]|uniref:hypothetical protein n=1 Tax=Mycobacterium sp. KBS0706 TaxID=2578109 RepID=UPI00110FF30E|nr:hypothetical protein [Mycobacterium sp. KBS0706]TSD88543.1 hypothetical protein FFK22_011940 [Mycobacterium sp. KBS0706]